MLSVGGRAGLSVGPSFAKELYVMYVLRHRAVLIIFAYACLVGVLASPLHAQVKGKPADPGTKAAEPSAAPRQEAITVGAKSAVLMEGASGQILAAQNKDEKIAPASFAKLVTLYIVYDLIRDGKIKLTDEVYISKKAWETGGSKMYVELGSKVPLEEIIKGIAIVSGNDACVAIAEHISGSVEMFVKLMNDTAQKLGMTNSHFDNPHGLPSLQQYTTAFDMAVLARRYIDEFPEALKIHSTLEYTYSGIRQDNRNTLLRKDASVDGLKTGFVAEAGFHLLATAKRDERRLIAVVMGDKNRAMRAEEALKLLNYGYRNFAFVSLFTKGQVLYDLPVWKGQSNNLHIVPGEEGMIVVPADQKNKLVREPFLPGYVVAPIDKNQEIGKYVVKVGTNVIRSIPLVAETDVPKAGFVKIIAHSALYFIGQIKIVTYVLLGVVMLALVLLILNVFSRGRRRKSRVRFSR
jgi:D-alanyl-D-alanine carboxypeptidase (penicillin-binding protein 5/6)